jgi:hypothetical protein
MSNRAQRHQGRPPSRRQARTRDRAVTAGSLWHDLRPRVPAHFLRAYQPAHPVKLSWHASTHSSVGVGCLSALPSRCVLRSVTHCGPTLSRTPATPQRVLQGRLLKCLPQADSSLRGSPARRCVPTQLQRRRDMRESLRDARQAAPRPRAGLGCDVRHVACGCRRSRRSRARPRTWDDGVDGKLLCHLLFSVHDDPAAKGRRCCASDPAPRIPAGRGPLVWTAG